MKRLIFFLCFVVLAYDSIGQAFTNDRSSSSITVQDGRLRGRLNFYLPHTHGLTLNGGLDTLGMILYEDSSSHVWYRDTVISGGHAWRMILNSDGTAYTPGSVLFAGANGVISQDNSNFFWDATNHRLGIGKNNPGFQLDVQGFARFNQNQLYMSQEGFGGRPSLHSTADLTFLADQNQFNFYTTANAASAYSTLFLTTLNGDIPSIYSGVVVGFDYTQSNHPAGKPLIITTAGFGNTILNTGGDVIIRAASTQASNYASHGIGNWNVIIDPAGTGVTRFTNTVSMAVSVASGATTITNSANQWVYTGSSNVAWLAPTVAGNTGNQWRIKNRGTGIVTLTRQGSDNLYTTGVTTTLAINPGESYSIVDDGTYILVEN